MDDFSNRFEKTLEAKVEEGDTLIALALRYHTSVSNLLLKQKLKH